MTSEIPQAQPKHSQLKLLEQTNTSLEKLRIQLGNRAAAIERGDDQATDDVMEFYQRIFEASQQWEKECEQKIAHAVHAYPVWNYWLKDVKGIQEGLAAQMLAMLLPPLPDRGPSTWYKAAGLTVEEHDGQSRLPRARAGGGKLKHHRWLRRCLHNVGTSFVRVGGYYREVYDRQKRRLFVKHAPRAADMLVEWEAVPERKRVDWMVERYGVEAMVKLVKEKMLSQEEAMEKLREPTMAIAFALEGDKSKENPWPMYRIDTVARWIMVKLFLSHLYEMWLESEGQTGRQAYVVEHLGHHYIAPPRKNGAGKI